MSETNKRNEHGKRAVQTTGHSWDGDLQEYNNPIPRWWLWAFYATVVFAVVYWFLYPAWPVGGTYTKGVMNTITYTGPGGEERTTHWNTRALLMRDMQEGTHAVRQREYLERVAAMSYNEIADDPDMMAFSRSVARGLFADNCAACHQVGGGGVPGVYPNLADDDWLWGGTFERIEETIREGRRGFMPAFPQFNARQLDDLASYVLSLSGHSVDADAAARGDDIFNGPTGGCMYCHGEGGTGGPAQGAPNLTNGLWQIVDVPSAPTLEGKKALVKRVVSEGAQRHMPTFQDRLSDAEIRALAVYVHSLGGGQ
ncbi:cytochrome-c oxidase, cbb3-type subunit III [Ectothiorhodospiraceae bacterium 2226]|nr:cytochrome-c oxidase, cbb3-type subunit III [Ectothiorhodospiraceae bacterium 2226]